MTIKNMKQLKEFAFNKLLKAVNSDTVDTTVREVMRNNVIYLVYNMYQPKYYERRRDNGGLSDVSNIDIEQKINKSRYHINQAIINTTRGKGSSEYLTPLVALGQDEAESQNYSLTYNYGYNSMGKGGSYLMPRNFIYGTRYDLKSNKMYEIAVMKALKEQGIQTKS